MLLVGGTGVSMATSGGTGNSGTSSATVRTEPQQQMLSHNPGQYTDEDISKNVYNKQYVEQPNLRTEPRWTKVSEPSLFVMKVCQRGHSNV